ncbi:tetratricopeptide repeat protein [Nonomuraea sp. NPDC050663]|uniref:tetratricopeptide repeat protein n=1 Tax=Nonomuraea sp. NPDC050663 TaxID=3364370 RepID=UPI00379AB755
MDGTLAMNPHGRQLHRELGFVGAHAFRREDSLRFFGRETEAAELATAWQTNPVTILRGAASVGKSSLLAAGITPLLAPYRTDVLPAGRLWMPPWMPIALIREDGNPLVTALVSSWAPHEPVTTLSNQSLHTFLSGRPVRRDSSGNKVPVLAAIDDVAGLFDGREMTDHAADLLDQVCDALDSDLPLHLLIIADDEHHDALLDHSRLSRLLTRPSFVLQPLTVKGALDALVQPVEDDGRTFAPGVAESLIDDLRGAASAVDPLLLQLACTSALEHLPSDRLEITDQDLAPADRSLAAYCDRLLEEVAEDHFAGESADLRKRLWDVFVSSEGLPEGVQREVAVAAGMPGRALDALVAGRLLSLSRGTLRIRHERLIVPLTFQEVPHPTEPTGDDHFRIAVAAYHTGWYDIAAVRAEAARLTESGPPAAAVEVLLGNIAYRENDLVAAQSHYQTAAAGPASNRTVATLLTAVGRILIQRGLFDQAVNTLESAVRREPRNSAIQTELAWGLWFSGSANGAIDVLDDTLAMQGNANEALRARAEIMADLTQPEMALRDLNRVRSPHPASTKTAYALAMALSGNVAKALEVIPAMDDERDSSTLLRAARVMHVAGRHSEAGRLARRAQQGEGHPVLLPPGLVEEAARLGRQG